MIPEAPLYIKLLDPVRASGGEKSRRTRAELRAARSWQNWGRAVLQSHVGESKLQAQAGESSGTGSVIFKEHFGGQEAGERSGGGGAASETLHFNKPPRPPARILFQIPNRSPQSLCEGRTADGQSGTRLGAPHFPVPSSPHPPVSSPHPLPLLVTGSGVTVWAAGIGLAFWSVHLCQLPAGSLPSCPSPPVLGPVCTPLPSSPTSPL